MVFSLRSSLLADTQTQGEVERSANLSLRKSGVVSFGRSQRQLGRDLVVCTSVNRGLLLTVGSGKFETLP
jgi:hypothetical protein